MHGREHFCLALGLAFALLPCRVALGVEGDSDVVVDTSPQLQAISEGISGVSEDVSKLQESASDILVYLRERDALEDAEKTANEVASEGAEDEVTVLQRIDSRLEVIEGQSITDGDIAMKSYAASPTMTTAAYGNTSPNSTYATYARGLIPKLGWNDHYVFMQDAASSYILCYGPDLSLSGTSFTGQVSYVRWYYVSQAAGYNMETGTASLSADAGSYTVLSDLGSYPMLTDGSAELIRREVMLYEVVAVVVFSLHHVWRYLLRNRAGFAD